MIKKINLLFILVFLAMFTACKTSSSTFGGYNGYDPVKYSQKKKLVYQINQIELTYFLIPLKYDIFSNLICTPAANGDLTCE